MKRKFTILTLAFVLVLSITACGSSKTETTTEKQSYQLYLDIDFDQNLLLATYDVDLYMDGVQIDVLPHGEYYTHLLTVEEGSHTLKFAKAEDASVSESTDIQVSEDTTFYCNLHTNGKSIEINDSNIFAGTAGHTLTMPDLANEILTDALDDLEAAGFVNISYKAEDDSIWDTDNWTVISQSVEADNVIDKNDPIELTCAKTDKLNDSKVGSDTKTVSGISENTANDAATEEKESEIESENESETDEVLTVDNCDELKAMLSNKADLDESYAEFAEKYKGRTIQFDGRIDYIVNYENYKTRYDILVSAGDYNPDTQIGPSFKFGNVQVASSVFQDVGDVVSVGQNVTITAIVDEYNDQSGLFFLTPVHLAAR